MRSVTQEVVAHLSGALDVPVSTEAPVERPSAFVLVDPVGGSSTRDALHADVAVQAWATSAAAAESLVRDACDAMLGMNADVFADPVPLGTDGEYRWWQATFTVHALW